MASISLKHLKKIYPSGFEAVKDFTLDIEDGELAVLVGPSGCGKSTVSRMISGHKDVTAGEIYIDGVLVNDIPTEERNVAMVYKNYALYPDMNVYDNLALGLKIRNVDKDEIDARVNQIAAILELDTLMDRLPKGLSEIQKLRLALGRAAIIKPRILLMEIPDLDAKIKGQLRVAIKNLHREMKTTILYLTHDPMEALQLAEKVVVMNLQEIQQVGTPEQVYKEPADIYVAQFFSTAAMNLLDATCEVQGDEVVLDLHESKIKIGGEKAQRLIKGGYDGKEIIIGIRPEDVHDEPTVVAASPNTVIEAKIILHERVDVEMRLRFEYAGVRVSARVDLRTKSRTGDVVKFALIENKIQLFDKDTEEAILGE